MAASSGKPLQGRTAIVTGGVRGLGLGIARRLTRDGARVAVWDWNTDGFAPDFQPAFIHRVDVSDNAAVEAAFGATLAALGQVDILVNNAGVNGPVLPSWDYPLADWDRVIGIDLNGVFYCCRAAIPHMRARGHGRIVNIASIAGKEGVQNIAPYSAAKGGVIAFTKAVAKELAQDGILVNAIAPAMVETELQKEMTPEHIAAMRAKIPMGRFLQVDEVAAMTAFIVGPDCSFNTGFVFDLTGGRATY